MKKAFRILVFLPIMLVSCYLVDLGNWNSRVALVKLFNKLPPDVAQLHVAVFEGYPSSNNLLVKAVFNPGDSATLDVPAGANR